MPANGDDIDPEKEMSIIYDNRSRISLRIKQLLTGKRHTQTPQSRLRRLVSNIELMDEQPCGDISVASNSMVFESSLRDGNSLLCTYSSVSYCFGDKSLRISLSETERDNRRL